MVKALLALASVPGALIPSQADMEDYVNNYINNTCQYLRYTYDETKQEYVLQDKLTSYNTQTSNTTFNFTLFMDYSVTERITHFLSLGDAFSVYLKNGMDTMDTPNIIGLCQVILTLDSQENKFKVYRLENYDWDITEPQVLDEVPSTKTTNEIFVLNQNYASNSELYKSGYDNGYKIGYNSGYGDGKVATTPLNNAFDLFKKISTSLSSFWNIPILPGINLGLLISIPITTGIVIWVVKALKE